MKVQERFARLGFELEGTGGNCTAFCKSGYKGEQFLVTSLKWDATAPAALSEPAILTIHPKEESESDLSLAFPTTEALLNALDRGYKDMPWINAPWPKFYPSK